MSNRFENVLVTGAAGFIGFHLSLRLLKEGRKVVGYDSVNSYYDPSIKEARLRQLEAFPGFSFY
ncbi:MAG TPA: NAD-dependent epimerase/dehydratase family protein, partial [Fimbriimonadaceae bacterium]|nr:NAD-dependent epimerase/dehydratase family protein [Fimbriimonadaceae bacterium]